jgi:hypothetical protein
MVPRGFLHEYLAANAGRLPQAEEAADFVMMQQTIVARFDQHRPRFVGTEQVFVDAVKICGAAAFEDEGVVGHSVSLNA